MAKQETPKTEFVHEGTTFIIKRALMFHLEEGLLTEADGSELKPGAIVMIGGNVSDGALASLQKLAERLAATPDKHLSEWPAIFENRLIPEDKDYLKGMRELIMKYPPKAINVKQLSLDDEPFTLVFNGQPAGMDRPKKLVLTRHKQRPPGGIPFGDITHACTETDSSEFHNHFSRSIANCSYMESRNKSQPEAAVVRSEDAEPQLLALPDKRRLNRAWVHWYIDNSIGCSYLEACKAGAERMIAEEFNEKMRVNVSFTLDPNDFISVKIIYNDPTPDK